MADHQIEEIRKHFGERQFCSLPLSFERAAGEDGVADSRTVRLAFASDAPVDHWIGPVILTTKPKNVRQDRMKQGLALLKDHDHCEQIGIVENFSFDADGIIRGDARFSKGEDGEEVYQDVLDGIKRFVSVGFMMYELHVDSDKDGVITYRCDDWEPFEVSIVAVPADISVGVGRSLAENKSSEAQTRANSKQLEKTMENPIESTPVTPVAATPPQRNAEAEAAQRTRSIVEFAEVFGQGDLARTMLAASPDVTLDDVRAAIKAAQPPTIMPPPIDPVEQARAQGNVQLARTLPRHGKVTAFKGDKAEEKAYRFGQWLLGRALYSSDVPVCQKARKYCEENGLTRAMGESVNETGGYTVVPEFSNDLIDLREEYGVFRRIAKVEPMSSETKLIMRRTSGLTAYFVAEAGSITASDKGWDQIELVSKKLAVLARYSSEISDDSVIDFGNDLANEIAYAFANKEDECGFNGDGTSTYGNIVGAREALKGVDGTIGNIKGLKVGTGNLYSELVLADFRGTVGKLPQYAAGRAAWVVHRTFYWDVMVAALLAGGGVTAMEVEEARREKFLGYPVVFSQVMPSTEGNSQVCALFGDFAMGATIGTRRDVQIAFSEHSRFANDQIEIRGTERFDINVHGVGDTTAAGPIVGLITAAS